MFDAAVVVELEELEPEVELEPELALGAELDPELDVEELEPEFELESEPDDDEPLPPELGGRREFMMPVTLKVLLFFLAERVGTSIAS